MAASLEDIRRRLREQEEAKGGQKQQYTGDNASYPFWNIPENSTAVLRFLPDGNDDNAYFWVERSTIRLPFAGVKGQNTSKTVYVTVPCMHTYGETCPITEEIKPWWKDPSMEDLARTYYKKRSFLYQGFVVSSPLTEESTPDNPIRRFIINSEIHNMIKSALMDPELDELPTDFENGIDFRVTKTKGPKYVTYETSSWSRRNRALSEVELAAITDHGLFNLTEFLPKKPDEETLAAIMEMFEASVDGQPYDQDKWGKFYRPQGIQMDDNKATATTTQTKTVVKTTKVAEEVADAEEVVVETVAKTTTPVATSNGTKSTSEVLAELRNRIKNKDSN